MECETCNQLLIELVYDELDEVRATAVRKHLETCATCKASLARMERGRFLAKHIPAVEVPAPSSALQAAIAAAASAGADSAKSGARVPAMNESSNVVRLEAARTAASQPARRGGVSGWFVRVGEVAMRRQVAMAAVFLMMIGVGLVYYQTHPRITDSIDAREPDVVPAREVAVHASNETSPVTESLDRTSPRVAHAGPTPTASPPRALNVAMNDRARPSVEDQDEMERGVGQGNAMQAGRNVQNALSVAESEAMQQAADDPHVESGSSAPGAVAMRNDAQPADERANELRAAVPNMASNAMPPSVIAQAANVDSINGQNLGGAGSMGASGNTGRALNNWNGAATGTEASYRQQIALAADDASKGRLRIQLAQLLARNGKIEEARVQLSLVQGPADQVAEAHRLLASLTVSAGDTNTADAARAGGAAPSSTRNAATTTPPSPTPAVTDPQRPVPTRNRRSAAPARSVSGSAPAADVYMEAYKPPTSSTVRPNTAPASASHSGLRQINTTFE